MIVSVFVNFALVLAFLKGGDLILRSHQKKAVQAFLEDMTLRVDDLNFKQISQRMTTPEAQYCFIVLAYALFAFGSVFELLRSSAAWQPGGAYANMYGPMGYYIEISTDILSFLFLGLCWRWPIPQLMSAIIGQKNNWFVILLRFIVASFLLFFVTFFVALALTGFGHWVFGIRPSMQDQSSNLLQLSCSMLYWPALLVFSVIFQAISALLQARMFYVRWSFTALRAVLWRIVEYEKGAFAAILLSATVVLTVLKEIS
jgi:hypothetical protein